MLGTNILEIVHPEDRDKACYRINERRTGKRCTKSIELRLLTKEEETVRFEKRSKANGDFAVFLINAEGLYASATPEARSFAGTQGIARDITELKKAQGELKLNYARLELLNSISTSLILGETVEQLIEQTVKKLHECFPEYRAAYCTIDSQGKSRALYSLQPQDIPNITGLRADLNKAPGME